MTFDRNGKTFTPKRDFSYGNMSFKAGQALDKNALARLSDPALDLMVNISGVLEQSETPRPKATPEVPGKAEKPARSDGDTPTD